MGNYSMAEEARIHNGEKTAFLMDGVRKTGQQYTKESTDYILTQYTKIKSKMD